MNFILHIWRQKNNHSAGSFVKYELSNIDGDTSLLEALDLLNEELIHQGKEIIAFDYDCREGICGSCSLVINGYPHGKKPSTTTCQLYMRDYNTQRELFIEPYRANSFKIIKDLVVDRSALDDIIQAGGYISTHTGSAPEANSILIDKHKADKAFDAAICIGCGACIAACPNASATLFVASKIAHLSLLPQGAIEHKYRHKNMLKQMLNSGFGSCSNHRICATICPQDIAITTITKLNAN